MSDVSSLVGSAVELATRNIDRGYLEKLKLSLARDAAEKSVLNGGYSADKVVMSPHIGLMVAAYSIATTGATTGMVTVMCSPSDSGKSTAARFFIHGKHPFRPERSLMVSAAGMRDFASKLSELLGVKSASLQLDEHLCVALTQKFQDSLAAVDFTLKAGDMVDSSLCFSPPTKYTLTREIEMYGKENIPEPAVAIKTMPVLIIDDFDMATEENKTFVMQLFRSAAAFKVFVFILTANEEWATTLVGLNGGAKIKPLHGNVNNADYILTDHFKGTPEWNSLPWSVENLQ